MDFIIEQQTTWEDGREVQYLGEGFKYWLPKRPKREEIAGWDLPKEEQMWRVPELPGFFSHIARDEFNRPQWTREQEDWLLTVLADRIINGYWFMNNGEPTYIIGPHYFELCFCEFQTGQLKDYRDTDRRTHYFVDYCYRDPK